MLSDVGIAWDSALWHLNAFVQDDASLQVISVPITLLLLFFPLFFFSTHPMSVGIA